MQLWTWQGKGFTLHSGRVDPSKGEYAGLFPKYLDALAKLAERLKEDQFIWASRECRPHNGKVAYRLEVPESKILATLDGFLWNRRIGAGEVCPPNKLMAQWRAEANSLYPQDGPARSRHIDTQKRNWWRRPLPDNWLSMALADGRDSENPQYILPFPIPEEWVMERR